MLTNYRGDGSSKEKQSTPSMTSVLRPQPPAGIPLWPLFAGGFNFGKKSFETPAAASAEISTPPPPPVANKQPTKTSTAPRSIRPFFPQHQAAIFIHSKFPISHREESERTASVLLSFSVKETSFFRRSVSDFPQDFTPVLRDVIEKNLEESSSSLPI